MLDYWMNGTSFTILFTDILELFLDDRTQLNHVRDLLNSSLEDILDDLEFDSWNIRKVSTMLLQ